MGTGLEDILMNPYASAGQLQQARPVLIVPKQIGPQNFPTSVVNLIHKVLDDNARKYKPAAWRSIPIEEHISHARQHLSQWANHKHHNLIRENMELEPLEEDEPHLLHALTRLAFAAELENSDGKI